MAPDRINEEWVRKRLDTLWPVHTAGFARLLIALRPLFDGDLDALLILVTLTQGVELEDWEDALVGTRRKRATRKRSTNTTSIADVTGIPRESVRRKLEAMRAKGWIERDQKGAWQACPKVAEALEPGTRAGISYLRTLLVAGLDPPKPRPVPAENDRDED
ncbi:hypothetical protein DLJ49_19515 [Rhodovulum sp. 12E13]|uniref:hypothetical protein n=1 Tax=Rhodovulum sp. 12E13 TaxID=2203891 RepID=UPI000E1AEC45|nr:hypothetical protein [Rhodovulum sp. 12E13]RDC68905.1 hypothetical protein DLJ49_19515 [Rhodovulum sp. 12E13]